MSLQVGIVQPSPAPNALALAPRPCWERLFSSSHGELGRAGFTRTAVFTQHFFCMRFMPFRLKSIRKDKLFQAVGRKHNAWLLFHEARPAEVTTSPTTGMVEESFWCVSRSKHEVSAAYPQPSSLVHVYTSPARLVIHTHTHGCRLKPSPGAREHDPQLLLKWLVQGEDLPSVSLVKGGCSKPGPEPG